jgi:eukaryotic-like serine/threonine-protein kinase
MKKVFAQCFLGFLFSVTALLPSTSRAQAAPSPLLGSWSGQVHFQGENKRFGLRFERNEKHPLIALEDLPDLKIKNLGPLPIEQDGETYKIAAFPGHTITFRLAADKKSIAGAWTFDGHELTFDLAPGALAAPADAPSKGRVAEPAWTFKTSGAIWSSPAVAGGTVYFGSNDGMIYALKADSGKQVWQFKTGGAEMGGPTLEGRFLYALSDDGYLYKLARDEGKLVWQFDTHGGAVPRDVAGRYDTFSSAATVAGGTVFIGSADKRLYAVDARTGREKWHFDTQDIVRSRPAVADGRVFIGSFDHHVYAVDARDGSLQWKFDTGRHVVSSPAVWDGAVFIGSRCSDLFALDATTGKVNWKFFYWSSWVESSANIRDGIVYIGASDSQELFAIAPATGKQIWNFDTDGDSWSTPAVTEKRVYIGAVGTPGYFIPNHGGFFAVDRATGKEVWRFPMAVIPGREKDLYGAASSPAADHGMVFFGGLDGTFYAFRTDE